MTPSGIEPSTFRLVAQCLNQLRHRVPPHCVRLVNSKVIALTIRSKDLQESAVTAKIFLWMCLLTATGFSPKLGHHQATIIQESEYIQKLEIGKQELSSFTSRYINNTSRESIRFDGDNQ
jgi:hypothetical protein